MKQENKLIDKIKNDLKKCQPEGRFRHTLGVVKAACSLAKHYGVSEDKAIIAALLHDYAKDFSELELKKHIQKQNLKVDKDLYATHQLLHGIVGANIAECKYQIQDHDILQAIRYHTTGRPHMSPLEKIIYLSDFIEENRDYQGVETLREAAYRDLDKALLQGFNNTIKYLIATDKILHCNTVEARNHILRDLHYRKTNNN